MLAYFVTRLYGKGPEPRRIGKAITLDDGLKVFYKPYADENGKNQPMHKLDAAGFDTRVTEVFTPDVFIVQWGGSKSNDFRWIPWGDEKIYPYADTEGNQWRIPVDALEPIKLDKSVKAQILQWADEVVLEDILPRPA